MNLTGGHAGELSPDAVRTAIDGVLYEEFTREMQPGYVSATDGFFFNQGDTVGVSFITDEDSGIPNFEAVGEQEEFLSTSSLIGNQRTVNSQKFYMQVPISDEAFRADMVGKRDQIGRQIGRAARRTQDEQALLNTYGDAFDGSNFTTPDGQPLASNSHVSLRGNTVDNLETGALSPDNLWTLVNSLANQAGQNGEVEGHLFEGFMSNFLLYKTAKEVMASSLLANSAENNVNIFDTDYGQVRIGASVFLDSANNPSANAATSYHIVSRDHQILRKEFYGLEMMMRTPMETNNDTHAYVAKFHEVAYPGTWTAYAGSNGTT